MYGSLPMGGGRVVACSWYGTVSGLGEGVYACSPKQMFEHTPTGSPAGVGVYHSAQARAKGPQQYRNRAPPTSTAKADLTRRDVGLKATKWMLNGCTCIACQPSLWKVSLKMAAAGSKVPLPAARPSRRRRRPPGAAGTCLDALGAKVACEKLGYFQDSFVHEFGIKFSRKSPIIHRGMR